MNGGMMKAAAHGAIAALAGLLMSTVSAQAADLGGNCCADLEERVAELEATTARKGNRRVSLTVSGQVSRSILYWNTDRITRNQGTLTAPSVFTSDGSGTYAGLDNHNQSTRFIFSGSAKIRPDLTAGFEFMTEWSGGARTSTVDQFSPDGNGATLIAGDGTLNVRTANWWLEDKHWGRMTVGRVNVGGPVGTIDLGGISTVAHFSPSLEGGGFLVTAGTRLGTLVGPTYGGDRIEGIRYDSPTIAGFVLQGTWGEDDVWSASLRYAGEFSGFRIAAGIGYEAQDGTPFQPVQLDNGARNMDHEWGGSLAVMHVPTGLFAQGHYAMSEWFNGEDSHFWMIQAGITKNWYGIGNTSFYGEYGRATDYIRQGTTAGVGLTGAALSTAINFCAACDSDVKFWGLGVVQQIDAAAMEVFIGYRHFDSSITTDAAQADSAGNLLGGSASDVDLIHGGARIRF